MRFWTLLLLIIVTVAAIFESTDFFEKVSFNPAGNELGYKTSSDDDTREREEIILENDREPVWGRVNFGSLDAMKTATKDANDTLGVQIGDSVPITDMATNATADSKVAPLPNGLTVYELPGIRPNGALINSFVFNPKGSDSVMAPRDYYLSASSVRAKATSNGTIQKTGSNSGDTLEANAVSTNISVFQVPYGEDHFIADSTGVATTLTESQKAAKQIKTTLTELSKLSKAKAPAEKLNPLLFGKKGKLSTDFESVNSMINTGTYSDAYSQGLTIALGKNDSGVRDLEPVYIKTELRNQDIYGQFDFIYDFMKGRKGSKYYSIELVNWAEKNADSIIHTLMTNYYLQYQFQGTANGYATPISMNKFQEAGLPYQKLLKTQGRKSKEPFYLYASIHPDAGKFGTAKDTKLPKIDSKYIVPDLAHIFGLYTSIHAQVWIGANGNNMKGSTSQIWQDTVSDMNSKMSKKKVKGDKLPHSANKVNTALSEYNQNNLVVGLSTNRNAKDFTSAVYGNTELIGALRLLLSAGEGGSGTKVILGGKSYSVTNIGQTKYSAKHGPSKLYKAFGTSGDMYSRWERLVMNTKDVPIQPAVFKSYWDTDAWAYIMMPTMMGGPAFPEALMVMMDSVLIPKGGGQEFDTLSYANRYIMAFNFKSDAKSKTTNTTGVVRVRTSGRMGTSLSKASPITFTGYIGGETFSIVDYFKAQDALKAGQAKPPIKAKTVKGAWVQVEYLEMFEDFFTIRTDKAFVGEKGKDLEYRKDFDFAGYKNKWETEKAKAHVKKVSPDYSNFFELGSP